MTTGQQLIEQGRQLGLQEAREEARQEGFQEGILEGKRDMLLIVLRLRFGDKIDGYVERRIATASVKQLDTWIDRVLSVATLTELLTD